MSSFIHKFIYSFNHGFTRILLSCLFLITVTLIIGFQSTAFSGFPKGYDFFDHASVIKIIRDNFPHVLWNPYWDFGTVLFPRNYPPLYHFLLAGISKVGGIWGIGEIGGVMVWVAAVNISLTALAIFGIVYLLTKKHLPALISALFYLSSSAGWFYLLEYGLYSRVFAQMMLSFAILALVFYFRRVTTGHPGVHRGETAFVKTSAVEGGWPYYLVVFSFAFVFLSHFLTSVLLVLAFFILLLLFFHRNSDRLLLTLKIFLPLLGLVAFFYLPLLSWGPGGRSSAGAFVSETEVPLSFLQLFKPTFSGLPFLSLPLFFFFALVVWLTRVKSGCPEDDQSKEEGELKKVFWGAGLLVLPLLFYVLGFWGRYFAGISPSQFLIAVVFFLSIFCGLGFFLLASLKILNWRTLFVVMVGFLALSFAQIPNLKKRAVDQFQSWPKLFFQTIDKERLYRFAHHNEVLGGAFNFYSPTLQTRGYWAPGVLFPDYQAWFEKEVFGKTDNPAQTVFLLDWYSVGSIYTGRPTKKEKTILLDPKLSSESFSRASDYEWVYTQASPILNPTDAPAVLVEADDGEYRKILEGLASRSEDSRRVIPLRVKEVGEKELPRVSSWEEMERMLNSLRGQTSTDGGLTPVEESGQKAKFINSQRREIELNEKFKGVLLKESYFRNWTAWTEGNTEEQKNKRTDLKIYQAGPGMMYAFLPPIESGAKVVFEYRQSLIEKIGILISLVTLVIIMLSWLGAGWRRGIGGSIKRIINTNTTNKYQ